MMKNKVIFLSLIIMILIGLVNIGFCANTVLLFAGGSAGGSYELHGAAIAEIVHRAYPEILVDYRPGDGVANVMLIGEGKADLAWTHSVIANAGLLGIEPFKTKQPGIMSVCTTYESKVQIVTLANSGINSFSQIVEEKKPVTISVGNPGSAMEMAARRMFGEYGVTYDDIISWGGNIYYKEMTEANDLMKLGKLDVQFCSGACPLSNFKELATDRDLKLLGVDDAVLVGLGEKYGYAKGWVKPANYDFVTEDTPTIAVMTTLVIREGVPEEVAYKITKAIAENLDYLYSADASLKIMTKDTMWQGTAVPLHPGAERYYREIGVIK
jgi:TRAP transporter TAXI family solute receptor